MSNGMSTEIKLHNLGFLLELLACAINETSPPSVEQNIDFCYIFEFAKLHQVANTAFYAIEKLNKKPEPELYKKWANIRNKNVHKNLIQAMELEAISKCFNDNNIAFLPFKGFDICNLYPQPDYRTMSDLDILIKDDLNKAVTLAKSTGYTPNKGDVSNEKSLQKPPFMLIELHNSLVPVDSPYYDYYKDFFSRCISTESGYKMKDEDIYIYNLVHLHKHYSVSGCGVRNVMDLYLLNKKLIPRLDINYLKDQLSKLNLTDFCREISQIGNKWFDKKDFSCFSKEELYILSSGAYGTKENLKKNMKKGKSKTAYAFSRLFPPLKWMQNFYPTLIKFPFLLPFFYVYRIFKKIFTYKNVRN